MTSTRSSLPTLGSRLPKKAISSSTPKTKTPDLSGRTVKSLAVANRSGIARPLNSRGRHSKTRMSLLGQNSTLKMPAPVASSLAAQSSKGPKHECGNESESVCSSKVDLCSEDCSSSDSNTTEASSISSNERSLYNGPQLVEACVSNALLHVLEPCGHRVTTTNVERCGENCKSTDSAFANSRTTAKFACAVCISKYVQEHYSAQRSLFVPSLDKLEEALGGFREGWKAERIARMERVWKNDAVQERKALEKLGRYCEAIPTDPDEETLVVPAEVSPMEEASFQVQSSIPSRVEVKTIRRQIPIPKTPNRKRQIPTSSSLVGVEQNPVDGKRGKNGSSRIPVGPQLSKK